VVLLASTMGIGRWFHTEAAAQISAAPQTVMTLLARSLLSSTLCEEKIPTILPQGVWPIHSGTVQLARTIESVPAEKRSTSCWMIFFSTVTMCFLHPPQARPQLFLHAPHSKSFF